MYKVSIENNFFDTHMQGATVKNYHDSCDAESELHAWQERCENACTSMSEVDGYPWDGEHGWVEYYQDGTTFVYVSCEYFPDEEEERA